MSAELLQYAKVLQLTTVGRKSGCQHVVELWFAYDAQYKTIHLLAHPGAGQQGTDWYHNVQAGSELAVTVRGQSIAARLVSIPDSKMETAERRIRDLFAKKYGRATISYWYGNAARLPVILLVENVN